MKNTWNPLAKNAAFKPFGDVLEEDALRGVCIHVLPDNKRATISEGHITRVLNGGEVFEWQPDNMEPGCTFRVSGHRVVPDFEYKGMPVVRAALQVLAKLTHDMCMYAGDPKHGAAVGMGVLNELFDADSLVPFIEDFTLVKAKKRHQFTTWFSLVSKTVSRLLLYYWASVKTSDGRPVDSLFSMVGSFVATEVERMQAEAVAKAIKIESEWKPAQHIKIAADSPKKLRKGDVYRLFAQASEMQYDKLRDYLVMERPDLTDEVDAVMAELREEGVTV